MISFANVASQVSEFPLFHTFNEPSISARCSNFLIQIIWQVSVELCYNWGWNMSCFNCKIWKFETVTFNSSLKINLSSLIFINAWSQSQTPWSVSLNDQFKRLDRKRWFYESVLNTTFNATASLAYISGHDSPTDHSLIEEDCCLMRILGVNERYGDILLEGRNKQLLLENFMHFLEFLNR